MLLGDIGETLRFAAEGKAGRSRMRLFHPLGFMLASPVESAEEGLSYFAEAAVEDKYDGIRAQAHVADGEVKLFSRTRDEITESFPELPDALAGLPQDAILDGEIVAWDLSGRPGPALQRSAARLGRKKVSDKMLREIPVAFLVFDVLYAGGELVMDRPLRERARILDELLTTPRRIASPQRTRSRSTKRGQVRNTGLDSENEEEPVAAASIIRAPVFRAASAEDWKSSSPRRRSAATKG